jgi:hypothetical protein
MSKFFSAKQKPLSGLKKYIGKSKDKAEVQAPKFPGAGVKFSEPNRLLKPKGPFIKDKSNVIADESSTDRSPKKSWKGC